MAIFKIFHCSGCPIHSYDFIKTKILKKILGLGYQQRIFSPTSTNILLKIPFTTIIDTLVPYFLLSHITINYFNSKYLMFFFSNESKN